VCQTAHECSKWPRRSFSVAVSGEGFNTFAHRKCTRVQRLTLCRGQTLAASCGLSGLHPYCALRNYFRTHPRTNGSTNTDSCLNSGPQSDSIFGRFAMSFDSNRLRWIFCMPRKWMVWLLMQIHDREAMHTICFREGVSPTYVLRNECVVLNQSWRYVPL